MVIVRARFSEPTYPLMNIVVMALCAVVCGADTLEMMRICALALDGLKGRWRISSGYR